MIEDYLSRILFYYNLYKRKKYDKSALPPSKLAKLLDQRNQELDILLYGDSVSERISNADKEITPLYELVNNRLAKGVNYYAITHSAYFIEIYYLYTLYLLSIKIKPKRIILSINLRSFSPQWDYNPTFQCQSHMQTLVKQLKRKQVVINTKFFKPKTINGFYNSIVDYVGSPYKYIYQFQRIVMEKPITDIEKAERKKQIFIYHYMNRIEKDHHKFGHLKAFVELCIINKIELFLYLTPINFEGGERFVGKSFVDNLKTNAEMVSGQVMSAAIDGFEYVNFNDLSMFLTSECFFNADETTEHLNEYGRKLLADKIINFL